MDKGQVPVYFIFGHIVVAAHTQISIILHHFQGVRQIDLAHLRILKLAARLRILKYHIFK